MGFFSKLKSAKVKALSNDELYENIFANISNLDEKVRGELRGCLENIRLYSLKNSEKFEDRGLSIDKTSEFMLKWIGCVEILIENGYAIEFDYKVDFEEFYSLFKGLKIVNQRNILPAEDAVYLDYEPTSWLNCIDSIWAKSGMCCGRIDIDSESYVVFPCTVEQLETLSSQAKDVGRKICRAGAVEV